MVQPEGFRRSEGEGGEVFRENVGEVRTSHAMPRSLSPVPHLATSEL